MPNVTFQVLCADTKGLSVLRNENQVMYSLLSNSEFVTDQSAINAGKLTVTPSCYVVCKRMACDVDSGLAHEQALLVELKGDFDHVEPRRRMLVDHLKHQRLDAIYILRDEVSEEISKNLYPILYKVENLLRGYLMKFMVTRLGPGWWKATASSDASQKAVNRRANESVFGEQLIDNKAYLIDFGDLGKMVYASSTGLNNKEDIVRRLHEIDETPEAIRALKAELEGNYRRFFKESFRDKGFQEKWEAFEKLRHKVAHTSLFSSADLREGQDTGKALIDILTSADAASVTLELAEEEKSAIRESLFTNNLGWKVISQDEFLAELRERQSYFHAKNGFVGLSHFVKVHLGAKGYDFANSYQMVEKLGSLGLVEVYQVTNEFEGERPVSAIKLKE